MAKDARVPIRMSSAQKDAFEQAAARDGLRLSTWFRWLAEQRTEEQLHQNNGAPGRPEPVAFVPGFGLDEEE